MNAEIHQLRPKSAVVNWMCSSCGVDAGCNCGAPLMSKAQRAAEALAVSPQKSNVMIAEEIGVGVETVRRARQATSPHGEVEDESRIGRDGKTRRMPTRVEYREDEEDVPATPSERRASFLIFSNEALLMAQYQGPVDGDVLSAAKATAAAWCRLVDIMEQGS